MSVSLTKSHLHKTVFFPLLYLEYMPQGIKDSVAGARKIKKKEQIEALMKFIDAKLKDNKTGIKRSKLELINCQLCSVA